jgi:hypothetical protein
MAKTPTKIPLQPIPEVEQAVSPPAPTAASAPLSLVEPAPPAQTAEVIQAKTRYGFPVYVPTQKKLLAPAEIYPLILDAWVKNQLEQERGALVRVTV